MGEPTPEQIHTLSAFLAEIQMFEKYTRRKPDAVMMPVGSDGKFFSKYLGLPVYPSLDGRSALVYNLHSMGEPT